MSERQRDRREREEGRLQTDDAQRRFRAEVWPHAATLLRVASVLTRDAHEAEDLAQESLLKAFRFVAQLRPDTDARKWLLTILRNTRTDRARAAANRPRVAPLGDEAGRVVDDAAEPGREAFGAGDDPATLLAAFSDGQVIDALKRLPEEIRWTLLLVDVESLDQAAAAEVLEVPVGTVKSRLSRGRGMLRELLLPVARDRRLLDETSGGPVNSGGGHHEH